MSAPFKTPLRVAEVPGRAGGLPGSPPRRRHAGGVAPGSPRGVTAPSDRDGLRARAARRRLQVADRGGGHHERRRAHDRSHLRRAGRVRAQPHPGSAPSPAWRPPGPRASWWPSQQHHPEQARGRRRDGRPEPSDARDRRGAGREPGDAVSPPRRRRPQLGSTARPGRVRAGGRGNELFGSLVLTRGDLSRCWY